MNEFASAAPPALTNLLQIHAAKVFEQTCNTLQVLSHRCRRCHVAQAVYSNCWL